MKRDSLLTKLVLEHQAELATLHLHDGLGRS
jgi:hypothetical protein